MAERIVTLLGSRDDLARAFVRATSGLVVPEVPSLDPPAPSVTTCRLTAPAADRASDPDRRCDYCGVPLTGRQRRFCSDPHRSRWHVEHRRDLATQMSEALAVVAHATGRLQQLCNELATGAPQTAARHRSPATGAE